jgi:hypothetical protein
LCRCAHPTINANNPLEIKKILYSNSLPLL